MRKAVLTGVVAATLGLALVPRAPQADKVERVQRACDMLRREHRMRADVSATDANAKLAGDLIDTKEWDHDGQVFSAIDFRVYDLFCK